jgi:hypothetical protein
MAVTKAAGGQFDRSNGKNVLVVVIPPAGWAGSRARLSISWLNLLLALAVTTENQNYRRKNDQLGLMGISFLFGRSATSP